MDEKAFRKGHRYLTVVNDLAGGRVLYLAEDHMQSSLDGFWETLTEEQISGIEAVAVDMWDLRWGRRLPLRPKRRSADSWEHAEWSPLPRPRSSLLLRP